MRYLPTRRQFVASFLAGSGMASAFAREWALCGPETARARYESFVASLRTAKSLDLVADVVTSQKVQGGRMPISSSIEARLARPGRGILHRERRGLVGTPESSPIVTEVLGDGDISYQVDPAAESYVRSWPPRFLAAGEGRGILPLREFLEEPSDPPRAIRFEKHPNKTDLTGLRLDYDDRAETLFFDESLALKAIIKEETTGFETMRTHFDVREFRLGTAEPGAEYMRKPIADYRDMTKQVAKGLGTKFDHARTAEEVAGTASPVLAVGDREVDAGFLDASVALVRLTQLRGRAVVMMFADTASPECRDAVKRLHRMAVEDDDRRSGVRFLVVVPRDELRASTGNAGSSARANFRVVSPIHSGLESAFGVKFHPTTFVVDRNGVVAMRGAVGFDEEALRRTLDWT